MLVLRSCGAVVPAREVRRGQIHIVPQAIVAGGVGSEREPDNRLREVGSGLDEVAIIWNAGKINALVSVWERGDAGNVERLAAGINNGEVDGACAQTLVSVADS